MVRQNRLTGDDLLRGLFDVLMLDPYTVRYYAAILRAVPDSGAGLRILAQDCGILRLFNTEVAKYEREDKYKYVKKYTSDENILQNIETIVTNQQELQNRLKKQDDKKKKVYLTEGDYVLSADVKNWHFTGLGNVTVKIQSNVPVDFAAQNVSFSNITFDKDYQETERIYGLAQKGLACLNEKDYRKAAALFAESRKGGNAAASWYLGLMIRYGLGLQQDQERADALFAEGDAQSDKEAAEIIANLCKSGRLFPADCAFALRWYEKSARTAQNLNEAAQIYEEGREGVPANREKAISLYKEAADMWGNYDAIYRYALLADIPLHEKKDFFAKAGDHGIHDAKYQLGLLHMEHYDDVFHESREAGEKNAFKLFKEASGGGGGDVLYRVGMAYLDGLGTEQSNRLAADYLRQAADKGHTEAIVELGVCYANGTGIKQSYDSAVKLYRVAAQQGSADAEFNMGLCCQYGLGVTVDVEAAVQWYKKAASKGHEDARVALKELSSEV